MTIRLVMNDNCWLGGYDSFIALNGSQALFVDLAVAACDGVSAFGDDDFCRCLVGIEDDDDVTPVVSAGIVL